MVYFGIGFLLGPQVFGVVRLDPVASQAFLEAPLKSRLDFTLHRGSQAAGSSARLQMAGNNLAGIWIDGPDRWPDYAGWSFLLRLPAGATRLLGAILAPTDPVLASDVELDSPFDRSRLRFGITGEAGMNDGTAFPFAILGLDLLRGTLEGGGWVWFVRDMIWLTVGGLAIGAILSTLLARYILHLRGAHGEGFGRHDFLALGMLLLTYGVAQLCHASGFLAVFAAGYALRRVEMNRNPDRHENTAELPVSVEKKKELAASPEKGAAYLTEAVLELNEHFKRMAELGMVILFGILFTPKSLPQEALWLVPLLFLLIRPASAEIGLWGAKVPRLDRRLIGWFGLRGIGSHYYLFYAFGHGLPASLQPRLLGITFAFVACSIVLHGASVTPLMRWFQARRQDAER